MSLSPEDSRRFTAWSAIAGGICALTYVVLITSATHGDTNAVFHAPTMLAWPTETRDMFRWAMLADIPGFYLAVLVIAVYLWRTFRDQARLLGDVAMFGMVVYVVVGVAGAAMLQASLHPLAHLHQGGDESVRAATEAAWTAVVYACQEGLWWCEGPLVFFWVMVVGKQLRQTRINSWLLLPVKIVGWCYGLFFVLGFFPQANDLTELLVTVAVLLLPPWMIWFGWRLLRRPLLQEDRV
jgi:hypothetical protein